MVSDEKKGRVIVKVNIIKKNVLKIFAGIGSNKKIIEQCYFGYKQVVQNRYTTLQ